MKQHNASKDKPSRNLLFCTSAIAPRQAAITGKCCLQQAATTHKTTSLHLVPVPPTSSHPLVWCSSCPGCSHRSHDEDLLLGHEEAGPAADCASQGDHCDDCSCHHGSACNKTTRWIKAKPPRFRNLLRCCHSCCLAVAIRL